MDNWISVEERLPPLYTEVLVSYRYLGTNTHHVKIDWLVNYCDYATEWLSQIHNYKIHITHWQPLPNPTET